MKSIFNRLTKSIELRKFRNNLKQYDTIKVKMAGGVYRIATFHHYNQKAATVYVGGYGIITVLKKEIYPLIKF